MRSLSTGLLIMGVSLGLSHIFSPLGLAQEVEETGKTIEMKEVVVTATRTEVPVEQTASSITVIDREAIEEKHLTTVLEALREVPSLDIAQTGGLGGATSAFLRGGNSSHTLVLIDGVPVNNPTTGAFDFADLTTENIERIEIVRGPQSTLYGSDAIGGVIQIFTRKGQGATTATVTLEGGSYGTYHETLGIKGASDRIDYAFSASRLDNVGFPRAAGGTVKDGYHDSTLSSRIGAQLMAGARLEWTARLTAANTDLAGCDPVTFVCPVDDPDFTQDHRSLVTSVNLAAQTTAWWNQKLSLSLSQDNLKTADPDDPFETYRVDTAGTRLNWQHDLKLGQWDLVTVGYEYKTEHGENSGSITNTLANNAGYALNQLRLEPVVFNLGVRFDDNSQFGSTVTYKAEGAYLMDKTETKFHAAYGTGFHGPTLNDLFYPGFGNPDLKPEKSQSAEAGIEQKFWEERIKLGATYFYSRYDDLIIFVSDPVTFTGKPENVQQATVTGTEVELYARPIDAVMLSANYTYTDTRNVETGAELARRPRQKANGTITVLPPIHGLRLNLDLRYVGKRFDDTANSIPMNDYLIANAAGTYDLTAQTALYARIENLFNRHYEEVSGYSTAGLSAYGGIKMKF